MKAKSFITIENQLERVREILEMIYEEHDTSLHDSSWEQDSEINDWNKKFNSLINETKALKEEMIFTFKIEED